MIDLPNPVNAVRKKQKKKKSSLGCTLTQFDKYFFDSQQTYWRVQWICSCMLQLARHQSRGARPLYGGGAQRFAEHAKTCVLSTCTAAFVYPQLLWLLLFSFFKALTFTKIDPFHSLAFV